jgi:hypothetical protein
VSDVRLAWRAEMRPYAAALTQMTTNKMTIELV